MKESNIEIVISSSIVFEGQEEQELERLKREITNYLYESLSECFGISPGETKESAINRMDGFEGPYLKDGTINIEFYQV